MQEGSCVGFDTGPTVLAYTDWYKYLGLTLDEHMTFKDDVNVAAQSAGRSLGSLMNKVKHCGNFP